MRTFEIFNVSFHDNFSELFSLQSNEIFLSRSGMAWWFTQVLESYTQDWHLGSKWWICGQKIQSSIVQSLGVYFLGNMIQWVWCTTRFIDSEKESQSCFCFLVMCVEKWNDGIFVNWLRPNTWQVILAQGTLDCYDKVVCAPHEFTVTWNFALLCWWGNLVQFQGYRSSCLVKKQALEEQWGFLGGISTLINKKDKVIIYSGDYFVTTWVVMSQKKLEYINNIDETQVDRT